MSERGVLLVCRQCLEGIGKKGGRKRAAIKEQLELLAKTCGLEIVKAGCMDVCPEKGVTAARVADKHDTPERTFVLKPKDPPETTLAKADAAQPPTPSSSVETR